MERLRPNHIGEGDRSPTCKSGDSPQCTFGVMCMNYKYDNIAGQARAIKIQKTVGRPWSDPNPSAELTALSRVQTWWRVGSLPLSRNPPCFGISARPQAAAFRVLLNPPQLSPTPTPLIRTGGRSILSAVLFTRTLMLQRHGINNCPRMFVAWVLVFIVKFLWPLETLAHEV